MSKTSQYRYSMYKQGVDDARRGRGPRWRRHPMKESYMCGYRDERRVLNKLRMKRTPGYFSRGAVAAISLLSVALTGLLCFVGWALSGAV